MPNLNANSQVLILKKKKNKKITYKLLTTGLGDPPRDTGCQKTMRQACKGEERPM